MNFINLKLLLFLLQLLLIVVLESTPLIRNKECYKRLLPKSIIIGVKKSGTYALIRYLSVNPFIKAALKADGCNLNEIHYFDQDSNYFKGIEWYRAQMQPIYNCSVNLNESSLFVSIEKTPGYFRNKQAAERIKQFNNKIRLILIVRDPVKRLQSDLTHCQVRQKKFNLEPLCANINKYFEDLFTNETNTTSLENKLIENKFIRNSIYYLDMIEWLKHFELNNFYVLNGEEFIQQPWNELNRVEKFLNLTQFISEKHFHFDKRKNFYCLRKNLNVSFNGCLGKNKGRKRHVYLSEFVKNNLKSFFHKWNLMFYELVNKKFNW